MESRRLRHTRQANFVRLGISTLSFLILLGAGVWAAPRVFSVPTAKSPQPVAAPPRAAAGLPSVPISVLPSPPASKSPTSLPASYRIAVPGQSQYPKLPNGCELTSLSMLLTAVGHPVDAVTLAKEMPVDPTPIKLKQVKSSDGGTTNQVEYWGNPNVGFVGDVFKQGWGYGIYNGPLAKLLNQVLPGRAENLTGAPFSQILAKVATGIPVELWTTLNFEPTEDWVTWNSPEGPVRATPQEHAVLLVGFDQDHLLINNPTNGQAAQSVAKAPFIAAWKQLGEQALTVRAKP